MKPHGVKSNKTNAATLSCTGILIWQVYSCALFCSFSGVLPYSAICQQLISLQPFLKAALPGLIRRTICASEWLRRVKAALTTLINTAITMDGLSTQLKFKEQLGIVLKRRFTLSCRCLIIGTTMTRRATVINIRTSCMWRMPCPLAS